MLDYFESKWDEQRCNGQTLHNTSESDILNNYVYSMVLKLSDQVTNWEKKSGKEEPSVDSTDIYSIHKTNCNEPLLLDLHGMTVAIAHSAVRTALQKEVQRTLLPSDHQAWCHDVIIITGKGNNSAHRLRPVLRPEVQRMLTEEFYPPLSTISVPNNIGALQILAKDVDSWLDYQKRQQSARLLAVANLLKSFAGGSRLRESIRKNFAKE